jgi:large subunit ribosomal protein L10
MPTPKKRQLVSDIAAELQDAAGFYLLSFTGLTVEDMNELRGQVRAAGGRLQVIKNRLIKRALTDEMAGALETELHGPTIMAFCPDDAITPAQILDKFATDHPGLTFKAGLVEGRLVGAADALRIAKLPPKNQILAETLAAIQSPASALVGVLTAAIGELVYVMEAQIDKQGATA